MPLPELHNRKGIIYFQGELLKELKDEGTPFGQKASSYKQTIQDIDGTLKNDRNCLKDTLKALNDMMKFANSYVESEIAFADQLENMGKNSLTTGSQQPCIGNALIKLALLFKNLSSLTKIKIKSINDTLCGPLKSFIDQGLQKDLRDSFEKTWKNYNDSVVNKKQKSSVDHIEGTVPFEDTSESKRKAKVDVLDFMIKFNEISSKTGADFVTQLLSLYDSEHSYFDSGKGSLFMLEAYMNELKNELQQLKQSQEADKQELLEIRDKLRPKPETLSSADNRQKEEYSLTQAANPSFGLDFEGQLNKRTEGLHRWQKRFCRIKDFKFSISHSQTSAPTASLYLLTCQVKETPSNAVDGRKSCFHLISHDRTYHFEAPNEAIMRKWTTVIRNNIDQSIKAEVGPTTEEPVSSEERKMREFIKKIIDRIRKTPGNDKCVDCGKPDPEWFAVNLGVLVCIHCSGAHRKLGSHNSRIRSLELDNPVTAELLLLYKIGNKMYNEVFKAECRTGDITPDVNLDDRHAHIRAKHEDKLFVRRRPNVSPQQLVQTLQGCIDNKDIRGLLQVYGEGVNLGGPIDDSLYQETALHIAVTKEDKSSLHIVDFLAQNCDGDDINKQDADGRTALHIAVMNNKPQSIKILLRGNANPRITDNGGKTPLDHVKPDQDECRQLLELAINSKHVARCDVVNFEWGIEGQPDFSSCELDYTDDELDTESASPEKGTRPKRSIDPTFPGYIPSNPGNTNSIVTSQNIAKAAAHKATSKKTFDPSAGGLVYNSSPRSSISNSVPSTRSSSGASTPRSFPAQSPYRNSGPAMNLPPNIAPQSSPVYSRTRKTISSTAGPTPGNRKTNKTAHSISGSVRGTGSVSRNRSFNTENNPLVPTAGGSTAYRMRGNRQDIRDLEEGLQRSCSVSVTSTSSSHNNNGPGATPPALPQREPPALPPRTQRRKVVAIYDCAADDHDELSFNRGDVIVVVEEIDDAWCFGMIENDDLRKGIFPKNFVRPHNPS